MRLFYTSKLYFVESAVKYNIQRRCKGCQTTNQLQRSFLSQLTLLIIASVLVTGAHPGAEEGGGKPDGSVNWEGDAASPLWAEDLKLLGAVAKMSDQAHACEAVACALWALCRHWNHPQAPT